jgi:hypothetical protein
LQLSLSLRQVIVDEQLAARDAVVLEAGSHDRSVLLQAADLVRQSLRQVIVDEQLAARDAVVLEAQPTAG